MSNNTQLLSRPIKDGCNFNALNPIVYHLRRQDYNFDSVNDSGGLLQLQFDSVNLTAYFQVDDVLYIQGVGTATVTDSATSSGDTLVTVDVAYATIDPGYVNNLSKRTDYKIEVEVFDFETNLAIAPRLVLSPNAAGEVKADISGIVRAFLSADWNEVALNEPEQGTSKKVYIKYQEFYDATYFDLISEAASPIVCVFAFIPIMLSCPPNFSRYPHGGNMLSYFPGGGTRKFLNRMSEPRMWRGYPFSLSFIWPSSISAIDRRIIQYDSEGNLLSNDLASLNAGSGEIFTDRVHRLDLSAILDPDAARVLVSLESSGSAITEQLTVNVLDPCPNQVLLFWKNCLGGDTFWMFDESQDFEFAYPTGRRVRRMRLMTDNLTLDQWDAINELNSPSDVFALNIVDYEMSDVVDKTHFRDDNQVYIINADATKLGVVTVAQPRSTRTGYRKHAMEVMIELPEFFTV